MPDRRTLNQMIGSRVLLNGNLHKSLLLSVFYSKYSAVKTSFQRKTVDVIDVVYEIVYFMYFLILRKLDFY